MIYPTLYKFDTKGKLRIWYMESEEPLNQRFRTISGLDDGKKVTSEWTTVIETNVGRSNQRSLEEQSKFEIDAQYTKQLAQGGYHETVEKAKGGSNYFEPMLAKKYEDWIKKPLWPVYSQPKLDGVRCIVKKDGMWSREGKPIVSAPHIFDQLKPLFDSVPELVLDGELYNHELKADFNKIISLVKKQKPNLMDLIESEKLIQYHVYDMVFLGRNDKFSERFPYNKNLFQEEKYKSIVKVETFIIDGQFTLDFYYEKYMKDGYEGQMIRIDGPYENKRSKHLFKRKEFMSEEFEVVKISEGLGNWEGYAKSVRCKKDDGVEFDSGIKGDQEFTKNLLTQRPKFVTVNFQNYTPDGIPRFPVAVAFYDEKRDI